MKTPISLKIFMLYCLLILGLNSRSHAQGYSYFGFDGGVSISNQVWEDSDESYSSTKNDKYGFYSGFNGYYGFTNYFGLAGDLAYVQKGSIYELIVTSPANPMGKAQRYDLGIDVLSFTPSLQFNYTYKPNFQLALLVGPRIDIFMSENSEYVFEDFNPIYNKTTYGFSTGLRMFYHFKMLLVSVRLTAHHDMSKILSNENLTIRNRSLIFGLGLSYKLH